MCKIIAMVTHFETKEQLPILIAEEEIATAWAKARYWNSKGTPVTYTVIEDNDG